MASGAVYATARRCFDYSSLLSKASVDDAAERLKTSALTSELQVDLPNPTDTLRGVLSALAAGDILQFLAGDLSQCVSGQCSNAHHQRDQFTRPESGLLQRRRRNAD